MKTNLLYLIDTRTRFVGVPGRTRLPGDFGVARPFWSLGTCGKRTIKLRSSGRDSIVTRTISRGSPPGGRKLRKMWRRD